MTTYEAPEAQDTATPPPEELLLAPIRRAIGSFVVSVEESSREMTAAAERFASESAQLMRLAAEARRRAAAQRASEQDPAVAEVQRTASAVTEAAMQAAASAREAAASVYGESSPMAASLMPAEDPAATRRMARLEEDLSLLTGLVRQVYDRLGEMPSATVEDVSSRPATRTPGVRRFRRHVTPVVDESGDADEAPLARRRFYAAR